MRLLLRVGLAVLFLGLGVLIFWEPETAKEYVDIRFKGFHQAALSKTMFASYIPASLIAKLPVSIFKVFAFILGFGCLPVLLNRIVLTLTYAFALLIIGVVLHLPYNSEYLRKAAVAQVRKLLFVVAVFFALVALVATFKAKPTPPQPCTPDKPKKA